MENSLMQIGVPSTQINKEPSDVALIKIELLFGEHVRVLGYEGDWAHVKTHDQDSYDGYMDKADLVDPFEPTHRITVRFAPVYVEPNFKNPSPSAPLYFNSVVTVEESLETPEGLMHKLRGAGWVFDSQLCAIDHRAPDFLLECLKFMDASYGYEKRGAFIDCSTLVQAGCIAAGIPCPYDVKSGEMEKLGEAVELTPDLSNLKRGDLVFWTRDKGSHVVLMVDGKNCFHATIAHKRALIQPLATVIEEQARDNNGPVTAIRRFRDYPPV
jgi:hypothetical protein